MQKSLPRYKRIMLKLSGEMLGGSPSSGIDTDAIELVAKEIYQVHSSGVQTAIVIGGGNFFRGGTQAKSLGLELVAADHMGMLATCINGIALQATLESKFKLQTRVMTAIHMPALAEPYIKRKAERHLENKRVVIFAGGTGNPLFTTDTAASLRAQEIGAEILLKATKVDGIYNIDPQKNPNAKRFNELSYLDVISQKLRIMDATSITMCMEANLPILVFKLEKEGSVIEALNNHQVGTIIK